jgi:hypothetical protein
LAGFRVEGNNTEIPDHLNFRPSNADEMLTKRETGQSLRL